MLEFSGAKYMNEKILSVIIPSYNMEKYLDRCISSLIVADGALLSRLDIIVVNDGSSDRTSEIGHDWEARCPGVVRVIDKPNGNYGSCINSALPIIQGRYVRIVDADDCVDKQFSEYLRRLTSCTSDMVLTDTLNIEDKSGETIRKDIYPIAADVSLSAEEVMSRFCYLNMNTITYKSSVFDGGWYRQTEGISYTDTQWAILPLCKVNTVVYIPIVVYRYTMARAGQTMESATVAKNFWMMGRCALDAAHIYLRQRMTLAPTLKDLMDARIAGFLHVAYKSSYRKVKGRRFNLNLQEYDSELLQLSPELYDQVEHIVSGHFLRLRCAAAWRSHSRSGRWKLFLFGRLQFVDSFVTRILNVLHRRG